MRALDILKNLKISPAWLPAYDDMTEAIAKLEELQERIKELETPKTCKGCMYEGMIQEDTFPCELCTRATDYLDRYEPKDKQ